MDKVYLHLVFGDGYTLDAEVLSVGLAAEWLKSLTHHIHCNRKECVKGCHMGRYPMREFSITISTRGPAMMYDEMPEFGVVHELREDASKLSLKVHG